jgi:hypothetical protein
MKRRHAQEREEATGDAESPLGTEPERDSADDQEDDEFDDEDDTVDEEEDDEEESN